MPHKIDRCKNAIILHCGPRCQEGHRIDLMCFHGRNDTCGDYGEAEIWTVEELRDRYDLGAAVDKGNHSKPK